MPTDLPSPAGKSLAGLDAQAALLSDALQTSDAFLVSQVLHQVAQAQGGRYRLRDDPKLSTLLATLQAMKLELVARPVRP